MRTNKDNLILKHYFQNDADKQNRLLVEDQFLSFLNSAGCQLVAKSVGCDAKNKFALYSFLEGEKPLVITDSHIDQASDFILYLYELKNHADAKNLGQAVEACFNVKQHLNIVDQRFVQFNDIKNTDDFEVKEFLQWVNDVLYPSWTKIKSDVPIYPDENSTKLLTLSPSDFGFHNTLEQNGKLTYIDFEYAGWDSVTKLACDFICQPERPISETQARNFVMKLGQKIDDSALIGQVNMLLPVHRVKWCCILLNVFRDVDRQRRVHSGVDSSDLLSQQLNKAKSYFNAHLHYLFKEK